MNKIVDLVKDDKKLLNEIERIIGWFYVWKDSLY
jgi:hypothetical protein